MSGTDKYSRNAFLYSTIVAFGGFVFGLDAALISGTVNYLTQEFGLTDLQLGTVVSAPGLGVFLALPLAGYASNALGRKKTLLIIAALYLISAISSAIAPSFWTLTAARFLGGLAFSSITLASMYIGEIAPAHMRGKLVSMTQINIVLGLSAAYFINYAILKLTNSDLTWVSDWGIKTSTWRWMLGSEIIFAIIWFLLLFIIPLSPSWLIYKSRHHDARKVLSNLYPENLIEEQIEQMEGSLQKESKKSTVGEQLRRIFSGPMRVIFIVSLTIAIAQQATGINAVLFYAPTIFEQIGLGTDAAFAQAIYVGLTSVLFTLLALFLIDKLGRRPMILWGMVWIIASLGLCAYGFSKATYTLDESSLEIVEALEDKTSLTQILNTTFKSDVEFKTALQASIGKENTRKYSSALLQNSAKMPTLLILLGILSFIAAFHFSVGPIMWVLFSELFPIALRGIAIPFFALVTSLVSYLIQKFFPYQLSTYGSTFTFLFYATTVAVGLLILFRFLPETKNLTIEEIQEKLRK